VKNIKVEDFLVILLPCQKIPHRENCPVAVWSSHGPLGELPGGCLQENLGVVWFTKCNVKGNGNGLHSITGGNKF
jgi:hypothetical protein